MLYLTLILPYVGRLPVQPTLLISNTIKYKKTCDIIIKVCVTLHFKAEKKYCVTKYSPISYISVLYHTLMGMWRSNALFYINYLYTFLHCFAAT